MSVESALVNLLQSYDELNPPSVDTLDEAPSALEFMRYVARNRPFVIKRGAEHWDACRDWSAGHLMGFMKDSPVKVAVTPHGNADAVLQLENGTQVFVEPLETEEPFDQAMRYIIAHSKGGIDGPVKYCQTQNDNLRGEYAELFETVPKSIPFARIALQQEPDAVNFWLGNSASTTALHKDNYENIYVQVRGKKHFTLLAPVGAPAVMEKELPLAKYEQRSDQSLKSRSDLLPVVQSPEKLVPVPTWDPSKESVPPNVFGRYIRPLQVDLDEGDMMYLPAMWFHHVSQSNGDEGFNCSINYWYDMDFSGQFWSTNALLKDLLNASIKTNGALGER